MAKLSEKQKLVAIGGTAIGICLCAGAGVWWAQGLIDEVEQTIAKKRSEIAAVEQKIAKIPATEKEVIILRENFDEYVKILPEQQGLPDFIKVLNQFEQQSGIQTVLFQPGRPTRSNTKNTERFARIEYVYEMNATLWQFLRFINLIENYERFVSITDFNISQKNNREFEIRDGEQVHGIRLTMETYTYSAKESGGDVEIPNYAEQRELLREEIFKRMQAIRIDKYEHRGGRGRRDIFADPRPREGREDGPPVEEQRAILDRFVGELQRLRDISVKLRRPDNTIFDQYSFQKELSEGLDRLETQVQEVASKQQITSSQLRLRWVKEVVEPMTELRGFRSAQDPRAQVDPYLTGEEMQQLVTSMTTLLDEGDLEGAKTRFEAIAPRLLVPETDKRYPFAVAAKALHHKIETAIEFGKLDIKIQGVLVKHDGGRSGMLLNNQVYEEGEYISDELMLRKVEEEQVWFVFRGLTLIRTF